MLKKKLFLLGTKVNLVLMISLQFWLHIRPSVAILPTFFEYCKTMAILFKKTEILNYCNTEFWADFVIVLEKLLKFLKRFVLIIIRVVFIRFKMILPFIIVFKLLFIIQNNCLKIYWSPFSLWVLQYFLVFWKYCKMYDRIFKHRKII